MEELYGNANITGTGTIKPCPAGTLLTSTGNSFGGQLQEALLLQDEAGSNEDVGTDCQSQANVGLVLASCRFRRPQARFIKSPVHRGEGRRRDLAPLKAWPRAW